VQAANESAWGRSRFARQGNNYFGQWCYRKGCGIVPARRVPGATHEVRRFASVAESVRAYMNNINRSSAYADFRNIRRSLRVQSKPLDAERLAYGLKSYSERGMAYVHVIRSMIRSNRVLISRS
jgi:Bax protein